MDLDQPSESKPASGVPGVLGDLPNTPGRTVCGGSDGPLDESRSPSQENNRLDTIRTAELLESRAYLRAGESRSPVRGIV